MTSFLRAKIDWRIAALLAVALQTAAVLWMVEDRATILRSPTAITLTPEPVDPRDLFRGDYVILTYPASSHSLKDAPRPTRWTDGWARLARDEGVWRVRGVSLGRGKPALSDGEVAVRAKIRGARLRFGLERYYVPEGEGGRLEKLIGTRRISVVAAIGEDGRAAIKGLKIDDRLVFEEPYY